MNKDKRILYVISFAIFFALLSLLFVETEHSRIFAALILAPMAVAVWLIVKKRRSLSINKKEVLLLSGVIGVIYVTLYQMSGIAITFYKNPYFVNKDILLHTVLPLIVIIVATEIIRCILLMQNNTLVSVITYFSCVFAEALTFSNIAGITSFYRFMDLVGLTLLPAITANVYYHYIAKRYGMMPNLVFRLITTLYVYFIPTITGMSDSLTSCIKIILPIVMLALIAALFEKKKKVATRKGKQLGVVGTVLTVVILVSVAMLISCQFRFGALVIATESMTGEINKGDIILYERYDDQIIKEGQVIVFSQYESKIVHRVVRIENIGGEVRYYTKGDANEDPDEGYRLESDIVGLSDIKISFLGYPTLWLRQIIKT